VMQAAHQLGRNFVGCDCEWRVVVETISGAPLEGPVTARVERQLAAVKG
jgi:hypothetical protein